jgi:signal transduction histidine kinase
MQYNRFRYRYCLKGYIESFNQFFRSNATNHPQIKGTGLGLSIVKKMSILTIDVQISSQESVGTAVTLSYHKEDLSSS